MGFKIYCEVCGEQSENDFLICHKCAVARIKKFEAIMYDFLERAKDATFEGTALHVLEYYRNQLKPLIRK